MSYSRIDSSRIMQVRAVVSFIGAYYVYNSISALINFERSLKGNLENAEKAKQSIDLGLKLAALEDSSEALTNRQAVVAMYTYHSQAPSGHQQPSPPADGQKPAAVAGDKKGNKKANKMDTG